MSPGDSVKVRCEEMEELVPATVVESPKDGQVKIRLGWVTLVGGETGLATIPVADAVTVED